MTINNILIDRRREIDGEEEKRRKKSIAIMIINCELYLNTKKISPVLTKNILYKKIRFRFSIKHHHNCD